MDNSPFKNLWKNIKTEKTKKEKVQQNVNSPVASSKKQSINISEDNRAMHGLKNSIQPKQNNKPMTKSYAIGQKQMNFNLEEQIEQTNSQNGQEQNKQKNDLFTLIPVTTTAEQVVRNHNKNRKLSIGEQSVVEEIVDFKQLHNLDMGDFQQDQQPMIMSLGSQSNLAIKQLKLSSIKDEIQKLQLLRLDLLKFINQEKNQYEQFFQRNFHNMLAYVIDFYAQKLENRQLLQVQPDQQFYNSRQQGLQNRKSLQESDTPRFPKKFQFIKNQLQQRHKSQIQKFEEQVFKTNTQKHQLQQVISQLKQDNDQLNEMIFDYEQKIAQFQLEVQKKVQEVVSSRLKDTKSKDELEADRKYYLDQIISLQKQIQVLERKSYSQQITFKEEIQERQQELNLKQKQFREKQKDLNELQVQLNSQKLDIQQKLKIIQIKQSQLRTQQAVLQRKQLELTLKERQFNKQPQKQSLLYDSNRNEHYAYGNNETYYEARSLGLKLKNLTDMKSHNIVKNKNNREEQNTSYMNDGNWRAHNMSDYSIKRKSNQFYEIRPRNNSGSKSKQKQVFNKTFVYQNRIQNTNPKSHFNINGSSAGHSSHKQSDKNRLEDLGAKLENLRNQIKKQIRDAE